MPLLFLPLEAGFLSLKDIDLVFLGLLPVHPCLMPSLLYLPGSLRYDWLAGDLPHLLLLDSLHPLLLYSIRLPLLHLLSAHPVVEAAAHVEVPQPTALKDPLVLR